MINARDLLLECWIANNKGFYARVTTLLPHYRKKQSSGEFEWHINGETEDCWSGIQLEPKMLVRNGWEKDQDDEVILSYKTPNNFYCSWIRNGDAWLPEGSIICGSEFHPILFIHELQLQYFAKAGEHLTINI